MVEIFWPHRKEGIVITTDSLLLFQIQMSGHYHVEENYMKIFSSFSANFPPHYHAILAINCVHASNWFTHLQQTRQFDGQNDNSVLTVQATCLQRSKDCNVNFPG